MTATCYRSVVSKHHSFKIPELSVTEQFAVSLITYEKYEHHSYLNIHAVGTLATKTINEDAREFSYSSGYLVK